MVATVFVAPLIDDVREIVCTSRKTVPEPSVKGSPEYFTGTVRIDGPFAAVEPARLAGAIVTFEPSARTAWHTHPLGQTLIVTSGQGWAQQLGGSVEELNPGDIVWIPPNEKHWHGATRTSSLTHIAIAEKLAGKNVEWLEKVSEDNYCRKEN